MKHERRILETTLCVPAYRMVRVEAWAYQEETGEWLSGYDIFPILNIEVRRTVDLDEGDTEDMWYGVVYMSHEGISSSNNFPLDSYHSCNCVCSWPETEDEVKLSDLCRRLQEQALAEAKRKLNKST